MTIPNKTHVTGVRCAVAGLSMCLVTIAGCAAQQVQPADVPEIAPGILAGYVTPGELPNSLELLPPPPAADSAALALDEQISRNALALHGTPRWSMATDDAELMFPRAAKAFECAVGAPISEAETPHLYMLLRRTLADAGLSTYAAKNHYQRARPFMVNKQPTCTPDEEVHAAKDGSYPSGHAAIGWAWALILTEIAPARENAILARGRAFGDSRIVCNVHWYSDVVAGRSMGAAAVARLHADAGFQNDLDAAKAEYAGQVVAGLKIEDACKMQAEVQREAYY